jgi:hypothetical protein
MLFIGFFSRTVSGSGNFWCICLQAYFSNRLLMRFYSTKNSEEPNMKSYKVATCC